MKSLKALCFVGLIVSFILAGCAPTPATPPLPTSPPTSPTPLSPTELKYRLLAQFSNLFFCDPDFYPIAREDEAVLANQRFPELQANAEEFQTILAHNDLAGLITFTDAQKLLIYREHKRLNAIGLEAAGEGYQFELRIADAEGGQGVAIKGRIDPTGAITIQQQEPTIATCPICLAKHTLIDTPAGPVEAQNLRAGMTVWTVNAQGARVAAVLLTTVQIAVPADHQMIHLALDDGRELTASPGHPTADGRTLGNLQPGDLLDGAHIVRLNRIPYTEPATYDLLPAGDTGFYWANGILVGSTLK